MSNMRFFNFWNPQTFHAFKWFSESGAVNVPELIRKATEQVEGDEWFKMGTDVSTVARDKLAALLREKVEEVTALQDGPETEIGFVRLWKTPEGKLDGGPALMVPILKLALDEIVYESVAEALLFAAGKWNPDRDLPEPI